MADVIIIGGPVAFADGESGEFAEVAQLFVAEVAVAFVVALAVAAAMLPVSLHGLVIVCRVGGEGAIRVVFAKLHVAMAVVLPVADFEAGHIEAEQMRAHVVGHGAEILRHDFIRRGSGYDDAQILVPGGEVRGFVLVGVIGVLFVMRQTTTGALLGFVIAEMKELGIPLRPPGEAVDAVKAKHMVDAEDVEHLRELLHPTLPPTEAIRLHHIPAIQRDAPVLAPTLHEVVVFKIRLRRRTTAPLEVELLGLKEHIRATPGDAKRHIAHEFHPLVRCIGPHCAPLAEAQPLHIGMEVQLLTDLRRVRLTLLGEPGAGFGTAVGFRRPVRPVFMAVDVH